MVFEESIEPPKKKLKQAQLPFCNQLVKSNKRKCTDIADDNKQAFKMICKDSEIETNAPNKENMFVNNADSSSNDSSMEICEVSPGKSTDMKDTDSEANENSKSLTAVIQGKEESVEITSNSNSSSESVRNQVDKNKLKCEEMLIADEPENNRNYESIVDVNKTDVIDNKSDDGIAEKTDININCNETLNQSQTFSVSSEDEKSDESTGIVNNKQVTPPSSENELKRKLTPKSIEKRKQRESIKLEKLQQKEREKEAKLKMKMEKEEQKRKEKEEKEEQKRKEKEERDEQKRKEREEKEKKKIAELRQKEDERRMKEEEKKRKEEAKEEEKRLKEEERRRKEETKEEERKRREEAKLMEQRKEEQAKKAFTNFFILKKSKPDSTEIETNIQPKFMPFPVKPDMRLAVGLRRSISNEDKIVLETYFKETVGDDKLYLSQLKTGEHIPLKTEATWPSSDEQHDVIIIESVVDEDSNNEPQEINKKIRNKLQKAKLLQFHENRRPAYWGTWRKKSVKVTPRRPFLKDDCLNYEVDSDSEWEDEGEGEDIDSENDSDKEPSDEENCDEKNENGYILDNTFVPHGYLSDEEIEENEDNFNPEDHKLRLQVLKEEFEAEMQMKAERLKPRLLGCVWISNDTTAVSKGSLYEILMKNRAVWDEENGPIKVRGPTVEESPTTIASNKAKQLSPIVMDQLVKFVHGNHLPFITMVQEFRNLMEKENYPLISKRALSIKIKEIARKEFDESGKHLWSVNDELCNVHGLTPVFQIRTCNVEKSKDTFLDNFLKRPSVSPQQQPAKAATVVQLAKNESSPFPSLVQVPSTPVQSIVKKRATLITLPQTPIEVNKPTNKVHQDTPRPLHPFFKNVHFKEPAHKAQGKLTDDGVIDLSD
ncbi:uncharacterized protein isoform X3 [Rhodnius prolixus]|uniref:uncharacterized protein isoform X3 n=1 Tax=Rhodnius prolixus TaxID=13249 RepID=UPI003D18A6DD